MDYRTGAEVTVATLPVRRTSVPAFAIMKMDDESGITAVVEKPKEKAVQDEYRLHQDQLPGLGIADQDE